MLITNTFNPEMSVELATRKWTLEELIAERKRIADENQHTSSLAEATRLKLFRTELTKEDFTNKTDKLKQYEQDGLAYDDLVRNGKVDIVALRGIDGAIRYSMAQRFNEAIVEVLPKFTGKSAGPKTREKFNKALAEAMGFPDMSMYFKAYDVSFYRFGGNDCDLWLKSDLYDGDNKFTEDCSVNEVTDAFHGEYPEDWRYWATLVQRANELIKESYNEYVSKQDALVHALKIGDTKMNRVHSYDMKEEA